MKQSMFYMSERKKQPDQQIKEENNLTNITKFDDQTILSVDQNLTPSPLKKRRVRIYRNKSSQISVEVNIASPEVKEPAENKEKES